MTVILILVCFVFPIIGLRRNQVSVVISDHVVRFFGIMICSGLFLGYFNLHLDRWIKALLLATFMVSTLWLARREQSSSAQKAIEKGEPNFLLAIPGFFVLVASLTTITYPNRVVGYLLNTWDGSSNAGLVRGMEVATSIDFSPETSIGPWIGYPRGAHYLASWLAEVTSLSSDQIAKNVAITFVFVTWIVYAFLILQIGRLLNKMAEFSGIGKSGIAISFIGQGIMLSPMLLQEILKLHSLAFITAMAVAVYSIVLVLTVFDRRDVSLSKYLMMSALLFVIACHTYPLAVPVVLITLISLLIVKSHFILRLEVMDQIRVSMSMFIYALGIVSFFSLINSTDPSSRYSMGGHMFVIELRWIYLLIAASLMVVLVTLLNNRKIGTVLAFYVIGLCLMWRGMWFLADSHDRAYGVNYYPKKMEYFLLVLLLPIALALLLLIWSKTKRYLPKFQLWLVICASLFVLMTQTWNGFFHTLFMPIGNDKIADEIVPVIIEESEIPGRSVIWDSQNGDISRSASFLTNYLDKSSWLVASPDTLDLNIILHQQLVQKAPNTDPIELCSLVLTKEFGPGRVVDFQNQITLDCSSG